MSGVLADYGFATYRLTDDWNGADFLAVHVDGKTFLRVQLKGRLTFQKKYFRQDIWLCFRHKGNVYLCPHDQLASEVVKLAIEQGRKRYDLTESWKVDDGGYSYGSPPNWLMGHLSKYRIGNEDSNSP